MMLGRYVDNWDMLFVSLRTNVTISEQSEQISGHIS